LDVVAANVPSRASRTPNPTQGPARSDETD